MTNITPSRKCMPSAIPAAMRPAAIVCRRSAGRTVFLLGILLAASPLLSAQDQSSESPSGAQDQSTDTPAQPTIITNSPFLPPDHNRAQTATPRPTPPPAVNAVTRDLEIRGIYEFDGVINLSIYNRRSQQSSRVELDKRGEEIVATDFNPETRSVRVTFGGSTARLSLRDATDTPLPVGGQDGPPPTPSGSGNVNRPAIQPPPATESDRPTVPRRRVIEPQPRTDG